MSSSGASDIVEDIDNPELTDANIARMRPAREVMSPAAYARLVATSEVILSLSPTTIAAFAEEGGDWKERMVAALDEAARKKRAA